MKTLLQCCLFATLAFVPCSLAHSADPIAAAGDGAAMAGVIAADEERMAAMKAGDRARLDAILSDELRYAHSNGKVDTKAMLVEALTSGRSVYESFDYKERTFVAAGPGVVLMPGRVLVGIRNGEEKRVLDLNFLAVWRQENGAWRFLAWQSSRNPASVQAPAKQ